MPMSTSTRACLALSAVAGLAAGPTPVSGAKTAPLIPRSVLFGNPDRAGAQLSPDGRQVSWLAPVRGVMNVWVGPVSAPSKARPVTRDTGRGITQYFWAFNNRHILYLQDQGGNENYHVFRLDLTTGQVKDLTPLKNVQARVQEVSRKYPDAILVAINDRNRQYHDIYRVDLTTGRRTLVYKNNSYVAVMTDDTFTPRIGVSFLPDFTVAYVSLLKDGKTEMLMRVTSEDMMTTSPAGFSKDNKSIYLLDTRGRDKTALKLVDLGTKRERVIYEAKEADISGVMAHPTERTIQAVRVEYLRDSVTVLDKSIQKDLDFLATVDSGDINVTDRCLDDSRWIVVYNRDNAPPATYLYDRSKKKAKLLFVNRQALKGVPLSRTNPVVVRARDGWNIVSYVTLPVGADPDRDGRPPKPLPTVFWIHGGPWSRDSWGYNPVHLWLANRGYAVISVNYRGSTGFGKKFINAGNREWGAKMHDDVLDVLKWAVEKKIADPAKVAITGGSYGGYETLVGLTFTPDVFACGVDIVGPSNLVTWMRNIPPYWMPILPLLKDRVGDVETEEGRAFLLSRSPLTKAGNIRRPLLIAQGKNDPRVPMAESEQIVAEMKRRGIPVTYVLYPDEGHGMEKPKNRVSFFAVMEAFLQPILGGRFEPLGRDLAGSSMQVKAGGEYVPGLMAAAGKRK